MESYEELKRKLQEAQRKKEQAEHRMKLLENEMEYQKKKMRSREDRKRTHRVANKGGTIEHFFPETKDFTEEEFFHFVQKMMGQEQVVSVIRSGIEHIKAERGKEA